MCVRTNNVHQIHYCAPPVSERYCTHTLISSLFTVRQLEICDQRVTIGMSERVSNTISRVKGTTWYAQRYQIAAVGEGQGAKKAQLEADSINKTHSLTHVRKHTNISDCQQQSVGRM